MSGATTIALSLGKAFLLCLDAMAEFTDQMFMAHPAFRAMYRGTHGRSATSMAIRRLQEKELIIAKSSVPGAFMLTRKGKRFVEQLMKRLHIRMGTDGAVVREKWDGKWRILVFDIPEKRKRERQLLRYELCGCGFRRMQKSVWISPHQIDSSFIDRVNAIGKLGGNIEFVVAESISNEQKYKKLFGLSRVTG